MLIGVAVVLVSGSIGVTSGSFFDRESSAGNSLQAWTSTLWTQTNKTDFDAGVLNNTDTTASPGDVKLTLSSGAGSVTNSPSSSTGTWINPTNAYVDGTNYASTTSTGTPSEIYGNYGFNVTGVTQVRVRYDAWSAGASITPLYEYYDTGDDGNGLGGAWSSYKICETFRSGSGFTMTSVQLKLYRVGNCGTVTVALFATTGTPAYPTGSALASSTIAQANISTNTAGTWNSVSLAYTIAANTSYAFVVSCTGGNSSNAVFWRCDATSPTYTNGMAGRSTSSSTWSAGSMDTTKDNMFRTYGNGTEYNDQIRVDVSWDGGTTWSNKQVTTLTSSETTYWYDVTSATAWDITKLDNSHFKVRVDAYTIGTAEVVRLDWLPVEVTNSYAYYASLGTIASQVLDTGVAAARQDALFWDRVIPTGTNVTFEVRASDTLFAKGDPSPTWNSVGGTSPVTTGLPLGRYKQWRATLTTSDTAKTPNLNEVRIYYP